MGASHCIICLGYSKFKWLKIPKCGICTNSYIGNDLTDARSREFYHEFWGSSLSQKLKPAAFPVESTQDLPIIEPWITLVSDSQVNWSSWWALYGQQRRFAARSGNLSQNPSGPWVVPWVPTCRSDWFQVIFLDLWCSGYLAKIPKINGGFMRCLVSSWENHLFLWAMVSMVSMAMLVITRWYDDLWWLRTSWKPQASTERARQWLSLQRHDHCWGACSEPLRHTLRLGIQRTSTT